MGSDEEIYRAMARERGEKEIKPDLNNPQVLREIVRQHLEREYEQKRREQMRPRYVEPPPLQQLQQSNNNSSWEFAQSFIFWSGMTRLALGNFGEQQTILGFIRKYK